MTSLRRFTGRYGSADSARTARFISLGPIAIEAGQSLWTYRTTRGTDIPLSAHPLFAGCGERFCPPPTRDTPTIANLRPRVTFLDEPRGRFFHLVLSIPYIFDT